MTSTADAASSTPESTADLRREVDVLRASLRAEEDRVRAVVAERDRLQAELDSTAPIPEGPRDRRAMGLEMAIEHMRQRPAAEVAELDAVLDLNDSQRDALKAHFARAHAPAIAALEARLRGEETGDGPIELQFDPREGLAAILTPEQMAAYEDYEAARRQASLETVASASLSRYSAPLGLDEAQKDAVYSAYYRYHSGLMGTSDGTTPDQREANLQTEMQNSLSPDQFAHWQQMENTGDGSGGAVHMEVITVESTSTQPEG